MAHLPHLILDLGYLLITAALVTLVFRYLKQPVVLGYLVAGYLVGPHFPFSPSITELDGIKTWGEIGVIFLLFGLGLEFSFKRLLNVGRISFSTAMVEVGFTFILGYLTGQALGWAQKASLFLGGVLCISSTTIIVRAFEELDIKKRKFAHIVFGILIVEDLFAILLVALLSTLALNNELSGRDLVFSGLRLGFFLVLWFVMGIYLLPLAFGRIRKHLNDETILVISIGLCLGMVMVANNVGFSSALGAFVMGSLLAETREGQKIERLILPVRDLFSAVFFVSVGMMLDPQMIWDHWGWVLLFSFVVILGKFLGVTVGSVISGQTLKNSMQAGLSLAQIGEFSFIIAGIGLTSGAAHKDLYALAIAVSGVTTFATPFFIRGSDQIFEFLNKLIPAGAQVRLASYQQAVSTPRSHTSLSDIIWQGYGLKLIVNLVVIIAITLGIKVIVQPWLISKGSEESTVPFLAGLICLAIVAPFLWAIVRGHPMDSAARDPAFQKRLEALSFGVNFVRAIIGLIVTLFIINQYYSQWAASALLLGALAVVIIYLSRYSEPVYRSLEEKFTSNLKDRDKGNSQLHEKIELAPWNATMGELIVSPDSHLVGNSLNESQIKENHGLTVALIQRGHQFITAPGRDEVLYPYDHLFVVGTDEQIHKARKEVEFLQPVSHEEMKSYGLEPLLLTSQSPFTGKSIRDCGLREKVHGLIVGIERNNERILSPDSSLILQSDDILWIVGNLHNIYELKKT